MGFSMAIGTVVGVFALMVAAYAFARRNESRDECAHDYVPLPDDGPEPARRCVLCHRVEKFEPDLGGWTAVDRDYDIPSNGSAHLDRICPTCGHTESFR